MSSPTDRRPPSASAPRPDAGAWILRSRALLDASARDLDGATRSRLQQARNAALAPPAAPPRDPARAWTWAGAAAVIAGVALLVTRALLPAGDTPDARPGTTDIATPTVVAAPPPRLAPTQDTPLAAPDFDLLLDAEDAALLEDLAFYAWLDAGGANDG